MVVPSDSREWLDPESWVIHRDDFLSTVEADRILAWSSTVAWEDRNDSRLLAWYGLFDYKYPGVSHAAQPIPETLGGLSERVISSLPSGVAPEGFDGALLNRYENGRDFVDFHADDEPSLRAQYPVAIVSLGAPRSLLLRPHARALHPGYAYRLTHGSLFVSGGLVQNRWHHAVPVEPQCAQVRVSITLRLGA